MRHILHTLVLALLHVLFLVNGCRKSPAPRPDDPVCSVAYIDSISIEEPTRALAILDSAEQHGLMSRFDINRLRCLANHNGLSNYRTALHYGLQAYQMPEARDDAGIFLLLVEMIADEYYQTGNYSESVRMCTEGLQIARDSLVKESEANLNVTLAVNLLGLDRTEEAFRHFGEAVKILDKEADKSDDYMASDDYVYALGMTIGALCDEKRYDEALALRDRYDKAMERLKTKKHIPEGLVDMRLASGYGAFAYMYALTGQTEKGAEMYRRLCETAYASSPEAAQLLVPYLLATRRYSEALRYLTAEKKLWQESSDTVSYDYIDSHLLRELEAYEGIGDLRAANRVAGTIRVISDTLRSRERHDRALELAEIYKTNRQAVEIERQSASIIVRNVVIAVGALFLIICAMFIIRVLRYNRAITAKNIAQVKTIDELMSYKEAAYAREEELLRLKTPAEQSDETSGNANSAQAETAPLPGQAGNDAILFSRMNHEILDQRLFLDPDFSKTSLMTRFRIPAYRFSAFFKDQAGCSFSQYVNNCRLDYAVKLMRENPLWTIDAIAKTVQMSNGAFYNQFKKKFGMSPQEFRRGEASLGHSENLRDAASSDNGEDR